MNTALFFALLNGALFVPPMGYALYKRDWLVSAAIPILVVGVIARLAQNPPPLFNFPTAMASLAFCVLCVFIFIDHTNYKDRIVALPNHLRPTGRLNTFILGVGFIVIVALLFLVLYQAVENGRKTDRNNQGIQSELNDPHNKEDANGDGISDTPSAAPQTLYVPVNQTQPAPTRGATGPQGPPGASQGVLPNDLPIVGDL